MKGVTRCLCYTHLRRAFVDALPKDIHGPEASKPAEAVIRLNKLFEIEKELDGLPPEQKKKERLDREKPLLEAFLAWAENKLCRGIAKVEAPYRFAVCPEQPAGVLQLSWGWKLLHQQFPCGELYPPLCDRPEELAVCRKSEGCCRKCGNLHPGRNSQSQRLDAMKYIKYILADMPGSRFLENPEYLDDYPAMGSHGTGTLPITTALLV